MPHLEKTISFDQGNNPSMAGQSDVLGNPTLLTQCPTILDEHVAHDWLTLDLSSLPNVRIFLFLFLRKLGPHGKYKNCGVHHLHLTQLFFFKTPAFLHIYT